MKPLRTVGWTLAIYLLVMPWLISAIWRLTLWPADAMGYLIWPALITGVGLTVLFLLLVDWDDNGDSEKERDVT